MGGVRILFENRKATMQKPSYAYLNSEKKQKKKCRLKENEFILRIIKTKNHKHITIFDSYR